MTMQERVRLTGRVRDGLIDAMIVVAVVLLVVLTTALALVAGSAFAV